MLPPALPAPALAPPHPPAASPLFLRPPRAILVWALALASAASALVRGAPWGLGAPLLVGLLLAALSPALLTRGRRALWLAPAALALAACLALRDSAPLVTLDLAALAFLLVLLVAAAAGRDLSHLTPLGHLAAVRSTLWAALPVPAVLGRRVASDGLGGPSTLALLRGTLLAAPLVLLFGLLFASADAAFAAVVERLLPGSPGGLAGPALWTAAAFLLLAAALGLALRLEPPPAPAAAGRAGRLGFLEGAVLLGALDLLFWAFGALQAAHLWGGTSRLLTGQGTTLAEAARGGFFQLLWVTGLALALLLALGREVRREAGREELVFRLLASGLVLLTLVVAASSSARLSAYEAAFGSTLLRYWSHAFVGLLAALLVLAGVTLWWRPERFGPLALQASVAALLLFNLANPEGSIVARNAAHHQRTGQLDLAYLSGLSADAVPGLLALHAALPEPARAGLEPRLREAARAAPDAFGSLNLARARARAAGLAFAQAPAASPPPARALPAAPVESRPEPAQSVELPREARP